MAGGEQDIDITKLRYVLYARKSSEDEGSQVRSIGDQIDDCKRHAESRHIKIVKILEEKKSAKKPNNRPIFREMIDDMKAGKYDGILFWHPDRLARNMLEAGEIIDLIDSGTIKDLQSPTFHFQNDSSGKMVLGMLFVFAKQYSEHLSENVLRTTRANFKEGISSGTPKWGYRRNKDKRYEPDENFDIIKQGWEMRANGASLKDILEFWKSHDVHRMTKEGLRRKTIPKKISLNKKATVSNIFRDPFYYGTLCQSGGEVVLTDMYDFQPMINKELYVKVQQLSKSRTRATNANKGDVFFPFRHMVICDECGKPMSVGASRNPKGSKYLYYRCDNKECHREKKSVRANVILDALYKELEKMEFTDKEYELFNKQVAEYSQEALERLRQEKHSLTAVMAKDQSVFDQLSIGLATRGDMLGAKGREAIERKMNELENGMIKITDKLKEIEDKLQNPVLMNETKEEFLNIVKSLSFKMRNGNPAQKDNLARILLLNIRIPNEKEPIFTWKEPFAALIKAKNLKNVQTGAPD